jgi:hypothetical protein
MTQLVLQGSSSKIEQAFNEFHAEHPEVFEELRSLAHELLDRGYERFGIATIFEVCRWRGMTRARDRHGFALNNNYRALYARKLMREDPRLEGVFNTRKLGVPSHVV